MSDCILLNHIDSSSKPSDSEQHEAITKLESGHVIMLPNYDFPLLPDENVLFTPEVISGKRKNISYCPKKQELKGAAEYESLLFAMMQRYSAFSQQLLNNFYPSYQDHLIQGKASFRPVEASGRKSSQKKDDSLIHVDAFPSNPVAGKRILRVFTNINPNNKPRHWQIGEPFEQVVAQYALQLKLPSTLHLSLLNTLGITKQRRTLYDALMLQLHDNMKNSESYQQQIQKTDIEMPANSSWMVFTDQVSHAVLSGQFVLEHTFYLPIEAMSYPQYAPIKQLENIFGRSLAA